MSNFNKVITNIPVPLTETEVSNLSQTLSGIVQGGGGVGEGKTYNGDGVYVTVNNDTNPGVINLTQTTKDKLNRPIPSAVADLTDADEYATKSFVAGTYQTIAGMNDYQTKDDMSAYLTKASASQNLAPISVTADIETLKAASGDFTQYYKKTETSSKEQLSAEFIKYQLSGNYVNQSDYNTEKDAIWLELQTLDGTKQNTLDFDTDEHGNISAINDIPLAGQCGTTYSAGAGIAIVDEYISLSADYIQAITQVSGKQDELEFTYDTSGSIIKINNSAIAGGAGGGSVSYTGRNGVDINGNYIELETTAKNAIDSVGGIATDVGTLKTASAGWDKVSDKLDTTAFSTVSGTFLTKSSADNDYAPISITATVNTLTAASAGWNNKVDKPTSLVDKYLVLRTDDAGNVSGWYDLQDQSYSKSEADRTFVATANIDTTTLSGGTSSSTKLGVKTDVIATRDYVNSSFLPLSGGTVSGDVIVKSTGTNLLAVNTTATLMGQSRVANLTDTTAIGTNWLGVNSNGGGFLKNVQGGNVGALNGTSIQIDFAPNGNTAYGNITVNSQDNISKVVHVPTASYDSMSSFDNTNGPNYMLRKTASGFDIGACVINVTTLPAQTEANTYYFIYDT